jgi:hypothetical protein
MTKKNVLYHWYLEVVLRLNLNLGVFVDGQGNKEKGQQGCPEEVSHLDSKLKELAMTQSAYFGYARF